MSKKTVTGKVVSTKMNGSVTVEVTTKTPHPLYKKLIRKSKKYIADSRGMDVAVGEIVSIVETRKISKNKYFELEKKNT